MNNFLKTAGIALVVSLVVVSVGLWLVGSQSATFGGVGITRYPNSGMAVRCLTVSATAGAVTSCNDGIFVVTGNSIAGNSILTGTLPLSTSTVLTAAQLCTIASIIVTGTTGNATITLPTFASMKAAPQCGGTPVGSLSLGMILNHSTNTVTLVTGASTTIFTQNGVGTTTQLASPYTMAASTTMWQQGVVVDANNLWLSLLPFK